LRETEKAAELRHFRRYFCGPSGPYRPLWTVWCGREDSNFHGLSATATSTLRVYQFRHDRTFMKMDGFEAALPGKARASIKAVRRAQCFSLPVS
jgi:hypothetical protein